MKPSYRTLVWRGDSVKKKKKTTKQPTNKTEKRHCVLQLGHLEILMVGAN